MKTVVLRKGTLHVETPLGIVNIYVDLHDEQGRRVECVSMIPNHYAGEPKVTMEDGCRFVEAHLDKA